MMLIALQVFAGLPQSAYAQNSTPATTTPIKHVIVIIGENRTFDHVYATYKPKPGETISNLLSKGIVRANGKPAPTILSLHNSLPSITPLPVALIPTALSPRAFTAHFLPRSQEALKLPPSLDLHPSRH
jgi:phospholipase C